MQSTKNRRCARACVWDHRMLNVPAATQHPSWQTRCCRLCLSPATQQTGTKRCCSPASERLHVFRRLTSILKKRLFDMKKKPTGDSNCISLASPDHYFHMTEEHMTPEADEPWLWFLVHRVHKKNTEARFAHEPEVSVSSLEEIQSLHANSTRSHLLKLHQI